MAQVQDNRTTTEAKFDIAWRIAFEAHARFEEANTLHKNGMISDHDFYRADKEAQVAYNALLDAQAELENNPFRTEN